MKKLLLTSLFSNVGQHIFEFFPAPKGMKIAFITTAADVYEEKPWMDADKKRLLDLGFSVAEYDLKAKVEAEVEKDLQPYDGIFVCGGNTFYLLQHILESGFDKVVKKFIAEGKPYIGSSAGSVVMGPTIEPVKALDNSGEAKNLTSFVGLGVVDFVMLPHYGKEKYEERYQNIIKEWCDRAKLLPLTDDQAVIVTDAGYRIV